MQMSTMSGDRLLLLCAIAGLTIGFLSTLPLKPKYVEVAIMQAPSGGDIDASISSVVSRTDNSLKPDIRIFPADGSAPSKTFRVEFRHPDQAILLRKTREFVQQFQQSQLQVLEVVMLPRISPNRPAIALAGLGIGSVAGGIVALARRRLRRA